MDIVATQVYEDYNLTSTQKIPQPAPQNDIQIGTLTVGSNIYPIYQGINCIGRHPDCDIVLNEPTVSKKHAEIETNSYETTAWVCDLNSSNNTKLNNSILRPNRCYELKNGNVLEFGLVRAVYKTCFSVDEPSIEEAPILNHRKIQQLIIPSTPDSSLNNSSSLGENISVIPATQADEQESVFRCPKLPLRTSTSSVKKSNVKTSSIDSVSDPESFDAEKKENVGVSRIDITEMETQKLFVSNNETNSDIHNVDTQKICSGNIKDPSKSSNKEEANVHNVGKQCITDVQGNVTDIHDVETQHNTDIHDMMTLKKMNVEDVTIQNNSTRDNKTFETEIIEEGNNNNNREMQEIEANESTSHSNVATKRKRRREYMQNIEKGLQKDLHECSELSFTMNYENDFDTSRNLLGSQNLLEDYIDNDELSNDDKSKSLTSVKPSLNDDDVNSTKSTDNESIFDAATQINEIDESAVSSQNKRVKNTSKTSVVTDDSDETDNEYIFQRYSYKNDKENEQFSKNQVVDSDDSTTDEEGQFMSLAIKEKANCSFKNQFDKSKESKNDTGSSEDSENLFDTLTQPINRKNKGSLSKQDNENDIDSDSPTQVIGKEGTKNDMKNKDARAKETDDMAPTQVLLTAKSPLKGTRAPIISTTNRIISDEEENSEIENNMPTQIINITTRKKVLSVNNDECLNPLNPLALNTIDDCSVDNIDYEMAPTQPINDIENQKSILLTTNKSTDVSIKSTALDEMNLDDTLERNMNAIFKGVNEECVEEQSQISTQILENVLQSSQYQDKLSNKNISNDTSIDNKAQKSIKGRKIKKLQIDSNVINEISRKSNTKNNDSQNTDNFVTTSAQNRNVSINSRDPAELTLNTYDESVGKEKRTSETCSSMNYNNSVSVTLSKCILDTSTPKSVPKNSSTPKSIPKNSSTPKSIPVFNESLSTPKSVSKDPLTPKLLRKKKRDKSDTADVQEETKIFEKDENELDECSRNIDSQASNTSISEQLQQSTKILNNDDEDILAGLPEVRISGTLSNPASPTSSISSEYRININHNRRRQTAIKIAPKKREASRKSTRKTFARKNEENTECHTANKRNSETISPNFTDSLGNNFDVDKKSVHDNSKKDKKFKQPTKKVTSKNDYKKRDTLPESKSISPIPLQEEIRQSSRILNYRSTRNSSKENIDRSSVFQVGKETLIENEAAEPAKGIDLNILRIGKRSLSMTDVTENKPKKRKEVINENATVDIDNSNKNIIANRRHSANILNYIVKRNSPINMNGSNIKKLSSDEEASLDKQAVIKVVRMSMCTPTSSISSSTRRELMIESNNSNKLRQSQRKTYIDSQVVSNIVNNENKKTTQAVGTRRNAKRKTVNKFKSHIDDISSQIGEESQEIEMIMNNMLKGESNGSNTEKNKKMDENTKGTRTKNTKGRRNTNIDTDVDDTQSSSASSTLYESDNAHFQIPIIKLKRAKISKNSSNKTNTTVNESIKETKENTKQSSRITRSRQKSITDSSDSFIKEDTKIVNETNSDNTMSKMNNSRNKRQRQKVEKVKSNKKQKRDLVEKSVSETNSSIETASIPSTPNRSRRSMSSSFTTSSPFKIKHKILFTGISNNNYNKLLTKLGASQVEDPAKCTVLVTDRVRRTVKFLCALSLSVPIVSVDWLVDSEKSGHFVELEGYILKDPAAEAKFRFKLAKSLEKAKEHKLLQGYTLVLTPNVAPPPLPELKSIIMSCGGKALLRPPLSWPQKAIIITREEDISNAKKICAKAPKTTTIQSTEFILTGILRQELEFEEFKLT